MLPQILMQRRTAGFFQQILEHQIAPAAFCKAGPIFFSQCRNLCVAVLAIDFSALVTVTIVETAFGLRHLFLPDSSE
jgi:hypothetical protein